jgi:hypothetical protein
MLSVITGRHPDLSAMIVAVSAVNIATIRLASSGLTIAGDAKRVVQERAMAVC